MEASINDNLELIKEKEKYRSPIARNTTQKDHKKALLDELKLAHIFSKKLKEKLV